MHADFSVANEELLFSFTGNRVLSLDTSSFWTSLGLLMLSQVFLNYMAVAGASEACCVLLILVRAVDQMKEAQYML